MAFPFKTGGDFYNCEAQRMRLHNLGANPTETATGLMYFNTGASNLGKHAVVHDGTNFKALAFVDEIATNTAFTELAERVDDLETALGTDEKDVLDTWAEVKTFLASIKESDGDLMTMLNSKADKTQLANYLPKSGGTIESKSANPLTLKSKDTSTVELRMYHGDTYGADVGWGPNTGAYLYEATSGKYIGVNKNGVPYYYNSSEFTLIHSGNIGDYAIKKNIGINFQSGLNEAGYGYKATGWKANGSALMVGANQNYRMALQSTVVDLGNGKYMPELYFNYSNGGEWIGWKYIAFTDSTVAAANKLVSGTTNTLTASGVALHDANGHQLFSCDATWQAFGNPSSSIDTVLEGGHGIYLKTGGANRVIINSSGNVTIGDQDLAGTSAKLQVSGGVKINGSISGVNTIHFGDNVYPGIGIYQGNWLFTELTKRDIAFTHDKVVFDGKVGIGGIPDKAKLHVVGDVYVEGNIIATKEVSAGGAGQEGESGDGGAEVIDKELAKGQSSYTIPNTIGRSAVAVSLYEANVINGQTIWSLCLADIEVTNATITVTFGSATSVNHKLVAVG